MAQIFIILAAVIHVYTFMMESLLWGKPETNKIFGVSSPEQAEHNRLFAFNQGFYNLFLAIAAFTGVIFVMADFKTAGITLMAYSSLSMMGAGIVLFYSQKKLYRAALIQAVPPFLALVFLALKYYR